MREKHVQSRIMLAIGKKAHVRAFRNNVGSGYTMDGTFIRYGLHVGSGDLIGWRTVTITPDMVGNPIAQFLSVEVKTAKGTVRPDQKQWLKVVNDAGGLAVVARDPEDVVGL